MLPRCSLRGVCGGVGLQKRKSRMSRVQGTFFELRQREVQRDLCPARALGGVEQFSLVLQNTSKKEDLASGSCQCPETPTKRLTPGAASRPYDGMLKVWEVATGECVATLKGHSWPVRCGVHCTFMMMRLRRRSFALPCFRTGGASCPRRATTRSSSSRARALTSS